MRLDKFPVTESVWKTIYATMTIAYVIIFCFVVLFIFFINFIFSTYTFSLIFLPRIPVGLTSNTIIRTANTIASASWVDM